MADMELGEKDRFIPRDISWLAFNERVLDEAMDKNNPLLERAKFLSIFVSNLDEFYMVRVAGLKNIMDSDYNKRDAFGYLPQELFSEIRLKCDMLLKKLYETYEQGILKEFEVNEIYLKDFKSLTSEQKNFVRQYFETTIYPIITPMAVDPGHPFPILPSKTLAFTVSLNKGGKECLAILPVPSNISRVVRLPAVKNEHNFILIDEIIKEHLKVFFRGYKVSDFNLFRVIRDSELSVTEEFAPDLLKAIEEQVRKRSVARVVYLEVSSFTNYEQIASLCQGLNFPEGEVVNINSSLDLTFLVDLVRQVDKPDLRFRSFVPAKIPYENIFEKISQGDFIAHMPFQSFFPTVDLIQQAANDKDVLAIKMTLYRTNYDSAIIEALKVAAKNKKQVTVLVEIKARFDEEKNIAWARELEEAGCHVIYGIPGLKIHSKMTLIVRSEEGQIKRYIHLSTGNYNEITAQIYSDIGYFTCNEDIAKDISDVFNVITGYSVPSPWKRIISSPIDLREYFLYLIQREIDFQKKFKSGEIWVKINSLEDPQMIDKLYAASKEGVKIHLIVRGICCLIPQVKGLSETIEVRSVIGRLLEHSRIMIFNNNGNSRVFLSSADWMRRNLDRRVELLFEIYKKEIKDHLISLMGLYFKDSIKTRILNSNRSYVSQNVKSQFNIQEHLIEMYGK